MVHLIGGELRGGLPGFLPGSFDVSKYRRVRRVDQLASSVEPLR